MSIVLFWGGLAIFRPKPLQTLSHADMLRLAAQLWWMALGSPLALGVNADMGTLNGLLRFSSMAGALPASLFLFVGGAVVARWLRAAAEIEHLVAGTLVAFPAALFSALLAVLFPFSVSGLALGDVTADIRLAASPIHAGAVVLLWGLIGGALGGLARYAWQTRGRRWDAFSRGPWPPLVGGGAALLTAITLATLGSIWQVRALPAVTPSPDDDIHATLALYARAAATVGLWTMPLAFDAGIPIQGHIVVGGPPAVMASYTTVPADTVLTLRVREGVRAVDPIGEIAAPPWPSGWLWGLVPLLAATLGGFMSTSLDVRNRALSCGLVFAIGGLIMAAWLGCWASGRLLVSGAPPPGIDLWAFWQADLVRAFGWFFVLGTIGAAFGTGLRRRWKAT